MKAVWLASAALAGAFALAAPAAAKTLKWSSQGDIATLDPYAHTESFTSNVQHHIYDPLVRRNRKLEIEPALATSWKIVEPNRWRFTLRQGVKFHNGETFDADDVVASITRLLDPAARAKGNLSSVERAEKVDDFTVDFVLKGPYPLLLNDLSGIFIMSRKWMEANNALKPGNTTTGVTTHASTNANGTGPFKLDSYKPDVGTNLVVNEGWWDKAEHNLTRIEFKPIKSDATRVAALLSGEIDMMAPAPLQDLQRIAGAGMKVVEEPSLRVIFLGLNLRPELLAMPGQKNPMLDRRVRQALWQAIDLDTIQKRVMRGKSRNIGLLVAPPVPGYDAALDAPPKFDADGAKKLLAEAGYPNGFKTRLDCPNDRYIADEQICVAIAAMWKRAGVDVELKTETRATYFPRQDKGETDAYMLGWATLPPMDSYSVLSAIFATRKPGTGLGGNNPNGLSDPRLDDLAAKAAVELDEPKRRAMLTEALKIARDEAYFIPLHQQPVAWAMKPAVEAPQFPDEYVRLWFARVN
ncbi:MAG: ABC transporter substrate-binding protein [Methylobacteriaceae bacterium]|nr:ABC transporter substrate-binding protein [Methylobacteriaceae bacterium]